MKTLITLLFLILSFTLKAQVDFQYDKIIYVHQNDTASRIDFDSLRNTCGRFFIGHSYIEKYCESNQKTISYIILDRAIKLLVNRYIVYYKCYRMTEPQEDIYYLIYQDTVTGTINLGYVDKQGRYIIEIYHEKQKD